MRRIGPVLLASVFAMNCGSATPTSPDVPSTPASAGTGGSTGTPATGSSGGTSSGPSPTGATAIDSDGLFDDGYWETEVQTFGAGGSAGVGHLHYLGQQDGDYRRITIIVNAAGSSAAQVAVFSMKRGYVYFPSTDGMVFSVSYSEDSIHLSGGGSQYSAPVLRQNGKFYTLVPGAGAFPTPETIWTPHSLSGLKQSDFRTIASASDHPDFSPTGTRIEVGFMRLHSVAAGSSGSTVAGGIDNWRITLHR